MNQSRHNSDRAKTTFTLHAVESLTADPGFVPGQVEGDVVTGFEGGRMKATFTPAGNLSYSTRYEIRLSNAITDVDESNPLEGNTTWGFKSNFDTKIPDVYSLEGTGFAGRDIAVLGDYAYLAGGDAGWKIINISDPTSPTVLYEETNTHPGSVTWSYRGVAVRGVQINNGAFNGDLAALSEHIVFADNNQFSYLRLYDVSNPPVPQVVGRAKLGESYTGIPGRLAISDTQRDSRVKSLLLH